MKPTVDFELSGLFPRKPIKHNVGYLLLLLVYGAATIETILSCVVSNNGAIIFFLALDVDMS